MDDRSESINRSVAKIRAALPESVKIVRVGPINGGWDDGVTIACGESKSTIPVWMEGKGETRNLERWIASMTHSVTAREKERLADNLASDNSFVWLYQR